MINLQLGLIRNCDTCEMEWKCTFFLCWQQFLTFKLRQYFNVHFLFYFAGDFLFAHVFSTALSKASHVCPAHHHCGTTTTYPRRIQYELWSIRTYHFDGMPRLQFAAIFALLIFAFLFPFFSRTKFIKILFHLIDHFSLLY